MKPVTLTPRQFEKLLHKLEKQFPTLLKKIGFNSTGYTWETICGAISGEITDYLRGELGVNASFMSGQYKGRGTEFSGGKKGTYHCWVELLVKLKKAYGRKKPFSVIIDGAYAQFFPNSLTPRFIRDRMRLTIFIDDTTAKKWYKGQEDQNFNGRLNKKLNL